MEPTIHERDKEDDFICIWKPFLVPAIQYWYLPFWLFTGGIDSFHHSKPSIKKLQDGRTTTLMEPQP